MKKYVGFIIICLFIAVYGWHFYYDTISNCTELLELKGTNAKAQTELQDSASKLLIFESNELVDGANPVEGHYYDFIDNFVKDTNCTLNKIVAKKVTGKSYSTMAEVESLDEVHIFYDVDILELVITVEDIASYCDTLNNSIYNCSCITIYPTDNCISVEFVVIGGVNR